MIAGDARWLKSMVPRAHATLAVRQYLHTMPGTDDTGRLRYDAARAAAFYDAYGDREWTRFHDSRTGEASLAIHTEYLRRFIAPGDHVLDVGAGPGRFTLELARLGARVTVADLSRVQLEARGGSRGGRTDRRARPGGCLRSIALRLGHLRCHGLLRRPSELRPGSGR